MRLTGSRRFDLIDRALVCRLAISSVARPASRMATRSLKPGAESGGFVHADLITEGDECGVEICCFKDDARERDSIALHLFRCVRVGCGRRLERASSGDGLDASSRTGAPVPGLAGRCGRALGRGRERDHLRRNGCRRRSRPNSLGASSHRRTARGPNSVLPPSGYRACRLARRAAAVDQ